MFPIPHKLISEFDPKKGPLIFVSNMHKHASISICFEYQFKEEQISALDTRNNLLVSLGWSMLSNYLDLFQDKVLLIKFLADPCFYI
jgi:hypothetical protein